MAFIEDSCKAAKTTLAAIVSTCFGIVASLAQETVARDDFYAMPGGTSLQADGEAGNPVGALANDDGVADPAAFAVLIPDRPEHGELSFAPDGTFTYTPNPNFHGVDRFTYAIEPGDPPIFLLDDTSSWKFLNPLDGRPPDLDDPDFDQTWTTLAYDDSAWLEGNGLMGYGTIGDPAVAKDTDIGTPVSGRRGTAYFRTRFTVPEGMTGRLKATVLRDDAAILYLDGTELLRSHEEGAELVRNSADDYFLFVEGESEAWTDFAEESARHVTEFPDITLAAGEHILGASAHNNLNTRALTSSDLGFELSLSLQPQHWATAEITVSASAIQPVIEPDVFFIAEGTDLDTTQKAYNLYTNDRLLDESGVPYYPILDLLIDTSEADGELLGFSAATGDIQFRPADGASDTSILKYQVITAGGTSESQVIHIKRYKGAFRITQDVIRVPHQDSTQASPGAFTRIIGIIEQPELGAASSTSRSLHYQAGWLLGQDEITVELQLPESIPIEATAQWKYLYPQGGIDPEIADADFDSTWFLSGFDDDAWDSGSGQFAAGTITGREADTVLTLPAEGNRYTAYFRHEFTATADEAGRPGTLLIARDDGAIIYLNGTEIARTFSFPDGPDDYFFTVGSHNISGSEDNAIDVDIPAGVLVEGQNLLAVSIHNANSVDDDLGFRCDGVATHENQFVFPVKFQVHSPMDEWRRTTFSEAQLADLSISSAYSDPDSDRLSNIMEYIYGTDPLTTDNFNTVTDLKIGFAGVPDKPEIDLPSILPVDTVIELRASRDLSMDNWTTHGIRYPGHNWISPTGIESNFTVIPRPHLSGERQFFKFEFGLQPWVTDVPR